MEGFDAQKRSRAKDAECNSLLDKQAWEVEKRHVDKNFIAWKWIDRLMEELSPDGNVTAQQKARLVALGVFKSKW